VWLGFFVHEKDGLKTTSQTQHQPLLLVRRKKATIRPDHRPRYNSVISTTLLFKGAAAPKAFTASQFSVAVIFYSNDRCVWAVVGADVAKANMGDVGAMPLCSPLVGNSTEYQYVVLNRTKGGHGGPPLQLGFRWAFATASMDMFMRV
jgi:hypothetical protein